MVYQLSHNVAAAVVAILGGAIYGFNTGIIAGLSKPIVNGTFFVDSDSHDQSTLQGVLTASILFGGFIGSFTGVGLANRSGRRRALYLCALICIMTGIVMGVSRWFSLLVIARTLMGLSVGFAGCVCPMYVSEMADHEISGRLGTVFQISICASILLAQIVNFAVYPHDVDDETKLHDWQWQLQFGLGSVPGGIMLVLLYFVPESHVWREKFGDRRPLDVGDGMSAPFVDAHGVTSDALHHHHHHSHSASNTPTNSSSNTMYVPMNAHVDEQHTQQVIMSPSPLADVGAAGAGGSSSRGWSRLFSRHGARSLFIAFVLAMASQLTGINAIIFYAPNIFKDADLSNVLLVTIAVVGVWNLLAVFISFALVDKLGRRPLMLGALIVMTLGSGILSLAYFAFPANKSVVAILSVILFIGAFECGPGPLFFVMASESFPEVIREEGLSTANALAWCFNIMISFGFPVVNDTAGSAAVFLIFTVAAAVSVVLIFFFLPETKDNIVAAKHAPALDDPDDAMYNDDAAARAHQADF